MKEQLGAIACVTRQCIVKNSILVGTLTLFKLLR